MTGVECCLPLSGVGRRCRGPGLDDLDVGHEFARPGVQLRQILNRDRNRQVAPFTANTPSSLATNRCLAAMNPLAIWKIGSGATNSPRGGRSRDGVLRPCSRWSSQLARRPAIEFSGNPVRNTASLACSTAAVTRHACRLPPGWRRWSWRAQTMPAQMPPGLYLREGAGPAGQESEDLLVAVVAH